MKSLGMKVGTKVLKSDKSYKMVGKCARMSIGTVVLTSSLNPWNKGRTFPELPKESFRQWYENRKK